MMTKPTRTPEYTVPPPDCEPEPEPIDVTRLWVKTDPHVSHMLTMESPRDDRDGVLAWLRQSRDRGHIARFEMYEPDKDYLRRCG